MLYKGQGFAAEKRVDQKKGSEAGFHTGLCLTPPLNPLMFGGKWKGLIG
jgi:hypothetical protein